MCWTVDNLNYLGYSLASTWNDSVELKFFLKGKKKPSVNQIFKEFEVYSLHCSYGEGIKEHIVYNMTGQFAFFIR